MAKNRTQNGRTDPVRPQARELQEALDWFVYLNEGEASAADRTAFQAWYDADQRHRAAYAHVEATWNAPELERAARAVEAREAQPDQRSRPRVGRRAMAVAAVVLLAVIGVGAAVDLPLRLQADYRTATGERREITLSDGATVLLDTASAIRMGDADNGREVELLAGRAFFDVDPARASRFRVTTDQAVIEVTGTQFVAGYAAEGTFVSLREGRLRVGQRDTPEAARQLTPGRRMTVGTAGLSAPEPVRFSASSAWIDGRLVFQDRSLSSLLDELRRYHVGAILLIDPALADVRLSGNYRLDDPARVVEQLAKLASASVTRVSDHVLVVH